MRLAARSIASFKFSGEAGLAAIQAFAEEVRKDTRDHLLDENIAGWLPAIYKAIISLRQQKTGEVLEIPIHAAPETSMQSCKSGQLVLICTQLNKPFTAKGFAIGSQSRCRCAIGLTR